jgi:RNA polymerase sigma-70 factor (ECF subfamily)
MQRAMSGDEVAYRHFLESVSHSLRRMVRRGCVQHGLPLDSAEDLVQETLLSLHLKRGSWDKSRPIGPWIYAIARNKLIDVARRRRIHAPIPLEEIGEIQGSEDADAGASRLDIERLLKRVKPVQRQAIITVWLEGASAREAAGILGTTEGAVRVALHRGLKSLSDLLRSDSL